MESIWNNVHQMLPMAVCVVKLESFQKSFFLYFHILLEFFNNECVSFLQTNKTPLFLLKSIGTPHTGSYKENHCIMLLERWLLPSPLKTHHQFFPFPGPAPMLEIFHSRLTLINQTPTHWCKMAHGQNLRSWEVTATQTHLKWTGKDQFHRRCLWGSLGKRSAAWPFHVLQMDVKLGPCEHKPEPTLTLSQTNDREPSASIRTWPPHVETSLCVSLICSMFFMSPFCLSHWEM